MVEHSGAHLKHYSFCFPETINLAIYEIFVYFFCLFSYHQAYAQIQSVHVFQGFEVVIFRMFLEFLFYSCKKKILTLPAESTNFAIRFSFLVISVT